MEIRGANLSNYEAGYLQVVRRETAESVKPRLIGEVEERNLEQEVARALLRDDAVALSDEAKALLKKLRKQMSGKTSKGLGEDQVGALLYNLKMLRDLTSDEEKRDEEDGASSESAPKKRDPQLPPHPIQLSGPERQRHARPGPGGDSETIAMVERMVSYSPSSQLRATLAREIEPMGHALISAVARFGVRIIILEPGKPVTSIKQGHMYLVAPGSKTFDGRPWETVRGLYCQGHRIFVVGAEQIAQPNRSCARHELAHAYDHAFQMTHKRRQPLSVQLFNQHSAQRKGVVSDYARTNPSEWFAETVERWFSPGGPELVARLDPEMHQYLSELLGR